MLIHPEFDPVMLAIGPVKIHWYGMMYLCGFACAYLLGKLWVAKGRTPFKSEQIDDIIFYGAMGVIFGGRIGYALFYGFDGIVKDPLSLLRVWEGGMSFHGGFIGVLLALYYLCRKYQVTVGAMFDLLAVISPLGLFFGRIGNFIGQELWGRAVESDVPWGMIFPKDPSGLVRHPSQLYQAAGEGLLLFAITFWFSRKPRPEWAGAGVFALFYGIFRFAVEFFRQPDAHIGFDLFGWMSRGQILSLPMIAVGLIVIIWAYKNNQPTMVRLAAEQAKQNKQKHKTNKKKVK